MECCIGSCCVERCTGPVVWSVVLDPVVLTELNKAGDFRLGGHDNMMEWPVFTSPFRRHVIVFLRVL